jgi:membrane-bound lytic murein transglycosylase D
MTMPYLRRALPWAAVLITGACVSAPPPIAPVPAPPEPVVALPTDGEAQIGHDPSLAGQRPIPVGRELLGNATYDLPMVVNGWVEAELHWLLRERYEVIGRWMERAERYEAFTQEVLASHGVPRDLHHLAMVESGYVPTARSRAGALGIWQFMPATGRGMGLRVDTLVDERMDPVRSTHAAARHLVQLHRQFGGDWSLAAAAYNAGGGRISRGMARFGARDFWELAQLGDLAQETRTYVPRLYAVTIIARNRDTFGYPLPRGIAPRFEYDSVRVDLETPLSELARIGELPLHAIAEMNPHLFRGTAPAQYMVWAPAGTGAALQTAYLHSDFRRRGGLRGYALRRGESLSTVAEASGVALERIRELNPGLDATRLREGTRIRLYADAARILDARPVARVAAAPAPAAPRAPSSATTARSGVADGRSHTVEAGESLWRIARRYGVSVAALQEANGMRDETIRPGQTLRLPGGASSSAPAAAAAARAAAEHVVESGETLWGIARRYSVSVDSLRTANGLASEAALQPGQKLRIPTD